MPGSIMSNAKIFFDGVMFPVQRGSTLKTGGVKREAVLGTHGYAGYTEETVMSELSVTMIVDEDFDLDTVRDFVEGTVRYEADNGISWMVPDATVDPESIELSDENGTCSLTVFGGKAEQE